VDAAGPQPQLDAAIGGSGGAGGTGGAPPIGGAGGTGGAGGGTPACPDRDGDGYADYLCNPDPAQQGGDCNDSNNLINPGRDENCANRIDNNCNGLLPADDPMCGGGDCMDLDGDGFQNVDCNEDRITGGDCDDTNAEVNPGVGERCGNGRDDDCRNGDIPCLANCTDVDLDGFGEGSGCRGLDCDDRDPEINPWRSEICGDGIDQDCNGTDLRCREACEDADQDGFGQGAGCLNTDCNDQDAQTNPGARDVPGDGIDQDCSGADLMLTPNCIDRDQDGYGDGASCIREDCDDRDPRVNTDRVEICGNRIDDDCRGGDQPCVGVGEGPCIDNDNDGFGEGACRNGNLDCDDNNRDVNPFAGETCNGRDDNCNEEIDECPLRNQVCDNGACVGEVGAPCREDDDCAQGQGLACNQELRECRFTPGQLCEGDAQCDPTATCVELQVCDDGVRCYQNKGGPCAVSCDCSDVWLCHDDSSRCVECLNDGNCNGDARDTCSDGGFCTELTAIGGAGNDARVQVYRRLIACWNAFAESTEDAGCDTLFVDATIEAAPDVQLGDAEHEADIVCDGAVLDAAGFDDDDQSVLQELFGCGLFDVFNIWWPDTITPDSAGDFCIYYAANKSGFGLLDRRSAIVIDRCDFSYFD
jgi:hypothetical protein